MRFGLFEAITGQFADGQPIGNLSLQNARVQSILDHVARLLNSRRGMIAHLPDYGLPDIQEIYQAMPASVDFLGNDIKKTIEKYEPRLRKVEVALQDSIDQDHRITFLIRGEVVGGEKVRFFTMFTAAGDARVGTQSGSDS